jgi:PadR family transcriptional regulator PadR
MASIGPVSWTTQRKQYVGDIFRDTFLGFVRVHVLYHAAKQRIFGMEMIEELREHGYDMSPGTLYPMLHAMEKAGYLRSEQEVVAGKVRKYYRITPPGAKVLAQLQEKIRELTHEVLNEVPQQTAKRVRTSKSSGE